MISLIFAMDKNRLIGKENRLPWKLPADMAYFREVTTGHTVIMGRKTFEAIGKALPGRRNIVITREKAYFAPGCEVLGSVEEVLKNVKDEAFVIGGAEIYKAFLPYCKRLYITLIDAEFEGDTYFPEIDYKDWLLVKKDVFESGGENPYNYGFMVYEKK